MQDRRRSLWIQIIVLAALGGLLLRLIGLQILEAGRLRNLAEDQAGRRITLPASRGAIYDRLGRPLAINIPAWSLYADPQMVQDVPATASALAPLLSAPPEVVARQLRSPGRFIWLARRLEDTQAARIRVLALRGIGIVQEDRRVYSNGSLAAPILGFTGIDAQGLAGVELSYDRALRGTAGRAYLRVDGAGQMVRVVKEGTGTAATVEGYPVAGKTGTAQKPDPAGGYARGRFIASFIGFVPANTPRVAILVTIDEPRGRYYGGEVAAPLFARIALPTLRYLRVAPTALWTLPSLSPGR